MPAHYRATSDEFLNDDPDRIVGRLTAQAARAGFYQQQHAQTEAWQRQIDCLRRALQTPELKGKAESCHVLLEYPIPRRGKRVDTVLLVDRLILVLEFKCGATQYARDAIEQVEDYCLDLRDFHEQSAGRVLVPFLVCTQASEKEVPSEAVADWVAPTWLVYRENLAARLAFAIARYEPQHGEAIDAERWDQSSYNPTPTIIESAQALYAGQNVQEISRCHAGAYNLGQTSNAVIEAISRARLEGEKLICFITGVPGAGKTLAGLNIVHNHDLHEGDLGVFLSGNGPLVKVLREALARDHAERTGMTKSEARRRVSTFIQNVHRFIDAYYAEPSKVPVDRVVIFDEAQRAWNADQSRRKFNRPFAEAEIMLEVMDRHSDWAVIVALIGGGQEINSGEAGLEEWGRVIERKFGHWEVLVSPELKAGADRDGSRLFADVPTGLTVNEDPSLHLSVNLRSYRAEALSQFVAHLLDLAPDSARQMLSRIAAYPLVLTRDLREARAWLKQKQRGSRRIGLMASSGARRLRAYGLDVQSRLDVENWFLNPPDDVRSSFFLETPATEFGIQGLELDWTCLCWGGDLVPHRDRWECRSFRGTKWQAVRNETIQRYIVNKYRVLLTRAREGTVIWVPGGDPTDPTRAPCVYDSIADYLTRCGIELLRPS